MIDAINDENFTPEMIGQIVGFLDGLKKSTNWTLFRFVGGVTVGTRGGATLRWDVPVVANGAEPALEDGNRRSVRGGDGTAMGASSG